MCHEYTHSRSCKFLRIVFRKCIAGPRERFWHIQIRIWQDHNVTVCWCGRIPQILRNWRRMIIPGTCYRYRTNSYLPRLVASIRGNIAVVPRRADYDGEHATTFTNVHGSVGRSSSVTSRRQPSWVRFYAGNSNDKFFVWRLMFSPSCTSYWATRAVHAGDWRPAVALEQTVRSRVVRAASAYMRF